MLHADFDLAAALARWHRHLATERRLAGKTLEAYSGMSGNSWRS